MKLKKILTISVLFIYSLSAFGQEPFLGEIRMFGGNYAPRGWAFCDGQLLPISQYSALFSLLGTMYGGDGRSTFALPDLKGRSPVHAGNGAGLPAVVQGEKGGTTSFTLGTNNLPAHNHSGYVNVSDTKGNDFYTLNGYIADSSTVSFQQFTNTPPNGNKTIQGVQTNNTGNGQPYSIRSPFLGIRFIIAMEGIYPSRN